MLLEKLSRRWAKSWRIKREFLYPGPTCLQRLSLEILISGWDVWRALLNLQDVLWVLEGRRLGRMIMDFEGSRQSFWHSWDKIREFFDESRENIFGKDSGYWNAKVFSYFFFRGTTLELHYGLLYFRGESTQDSSLSFLRLLQRLQKSLLLITRGALHSDFFSFFLFWAFEGLYHEMRANSLGSSTKDIKSFSEMFSRTFGHHSGAFQAYKRV